jgi:hypothetical protein
MREMACHFLWEKGEKGAEINSSISLIQSPYFMHMLLLNFFLFFEFYSQKNNKKVLLAHGLPGFLFEFLLFHEKCV